MVLSLLRRCCVVTTFATLFFMLSSPLRADLATARIALQTRQFELALDQAKDLATTYPFDSAMIAARTHVELGQLHQALRAAKRAQALEPKLAAPRILRAIALHRLGNTRGGQISHNGGGQHTTDCRKSGHDAEAAQDRKRHEMA